MKLLRIFSIAVFISSALVAQSFTEQQVRLVVRNATPGIPEGHFAGKPKLIQRFGFNYARIDEQLNPENKLHLLIVSKAPDTWMVNLTDSTGQHIVDPDPKGKVRFPVFPGESIASTFPKEFDQLEFGNEQSFFTSHKCPIIKIPSDSGGIIKQAYISGEWQVLLYKKNEGSHPRMLILMKVDQVMQVVEYQEYEFLLKPDLKVFEVPSGVRFKG